MANDKTKRTLSVILGHLIVTKYVHITEQHDRTFMSFI